MTDKSNVMSFPAERPLPRTVMETKLLTLHDLEDWKQPSFQRPIRINNKVVQFSEELKSNGGIISGVITLGQLPGDPSLYKVDGAHRTEAAKMSQLEEFIADVRITQYATIAEMAADFVRLNESLVRMRTDDILRGLEENEPALKRLRRECDFIGYDNIRRAATSSCVASMSAVVRSWDGSRNETPSAGRSAVDIVKDLTDIELQNLSGFMQAAFSAWGKDPEYYPLWLVLNLTMCMWLFRQLVLKAPDRKSKTVALNLQQFRQCLQSVSADSKYLDWLSGRKLSERDRSPCYARLRQIFLDRLMDTGLRRRPLFPSPAWTKS